MLCFLGWRGRRVGVLSLLRFEFRPFTRVPSCSSFCVSICTDTHLPTHSPLVRPHGHPPVRPSSFHLSVHPHTHLSSSYPSVCPCIHPPISVHLPSHVLIKHVLCSGSRCRALLTTKAYPHLPESYQGWRWGKTDQCESTSPSDLTQSLHWRQDCAMPGERKAHSPGVRGLGSNPVSSSY